MLKIETEIAEFLAFEATLSDPNIGVLAFKDIVDLTKISGRHVSMVVFGDDKLRLFGFEVINFFDTNRQDIILGNKDGLVDCREVIFNEGRYRYEE